METKRDCSSNSPIHQVDPPAGTFCFREIALIYAAALAVEGLAGKLG